MIFFKRSYLYSTALTLMCLLIFNVAFAQKLNWIPFKWDAENIEGRYFDKFAILVPISIDNLPHNFQMQLDLGAEHTTIYGNSIQRYLEKYNELNNKIDTSLHFYINNHQFPMFRDISLKLGEVPFGKASIGYFKGYGEGIPADSVNTFSAKHIGTIAPDIFQHKILIIDYPNQRICVTDKLPAKYAKASFQPFKLKNGRIKIPLNIGGQLSDLMFDTGSSMFALLTTEKRADEISNKTIVDSIKTSSWGEHYFVYGRKTTVPIKFANILLKPTIVFADKKNRFDDFYNQESMWGLTGNAYFLNNVVIIDYQNHLLGVK